MKPLALVSATWVQPVLLGDVYEGRTRADSATTLRAEEFGVVVRRGKRTTLVPWANVKQADAE